MPREYFGICVGGPKDGLRVTCSTLDYQVVDKSPGAADATTSYRYLPISADDIGTALWVPSEKDLAWALRRLVDQYEQACRLRRAAGGN